MKKTAYLPVRMSPDMKKDLKDVAKNRGPEPIPPAQLAREYIAEGLARDKKKLKRKKK